MLHAKWVEQHVREHELDRATYQRLYKTRGLPAGFPSEPRQQWSDWSWWEVRANGVSRRELIREYSVAKMQIALWRTVHGKIAGPSAFEQARRAHSELHVFPLQPDNPKSGGLRGWISCDDFLGSKSSVETYQRNVMPSALIAECQALGVSESIAKWLVSKGLVSQWLIQAHSNQLAQYCKQRDDWASILSMLPGSGRLPSWTFETAASELAEVGCFSWRDFKQRRKLELRLSRLPYHLERIGGQGIFEEAKRITARAAGITADAR